MVTITSYNTVVTKTTFEAESRVTSVDLNQRPIKDNDLESAFLNCIRLQTLKNSVTSVVNLDRAFYNCTALKNVPEIPQACTSMNSTFQNCIVFNSAVTIPNSVQNIEDCFNGCKNLSITPTLGSGISSLKRTFKNTSLKQTPNIPNSVEDMEEAFYNCSQITNVNNLSANTKTMEKAFYNCSSLNTIPEIPASVTNVNSCFYNCANLKGIIIINSKNIEDAGEPPQVNPKENEESSETPVKIKPSTECFYLPNSTVADRNVYLPMQETVNGVLKDTKTYDSFKKAGYSSTSRKHGVLLFPLNTRMVTFTITGGGEEIKDIEDIVVTVTYNDSTYTCINTLSTHPNGKCISGCAKNVFYFPIPNGVSFRYTVTPNPEGSLKDVYNSFTGSGAAGYEERNINVDLTRKQTTFTVTVTPSGSTINLYVNDSTTPITGTDSVSYTHVTGSVLSMRCVGSNKNLLSVEETFLWNTDKTASEYVDLSKKSYKYGDLIYESNTPNQVGKANLYKDYIYEITCIGGGGGSSYGFGGAGSMWKGNIHPSSNVTLTMKTAAGGAGAAYRPRNHDGSEGYSSTISGTNVSITSYGGHPGQAARSGHQHYKNGYRISPEPSSNIHFSREVIFANTKTERRESWLSGTSYGAGGNGGYYKHGTGETGNGGYIKIMYVGMEVKESGDDGAGVKKLERWDNDATTPSINPISLEAGLYRITCVGGGGGALLFESPTSTSTYYKATGGSGGGFKATVYLTEGDYTWHVGEKGTSAKVPGAVTDGENTTLSGNGITITAYGGKAGSVENGVYKKGEGGETAEINTTVYEMVFNNTGNSGSVDEGSSTTLAGGASVYDGRGIGGSISNGSPREGTNGYIKIVKLS